jgi:hypothetical protein
LRSDYLEAKHQKTLNRSIVPAVEMHETILDNVGYMQMVPGSRNTLSGSPKEKKNQERKKKGNQS